MWDWLLRLVGLPRIPPLVRQARHLDPAVRRCAAEELGPVSEPWAAPTLIDLLADAHTDVRQAAAAALRGRGPAAVPGLVTGLGHGNPESAWRAAELLGELRAADAVPSLLTALKFAARPVQNEARRALVRIGPAAVPALEEARGDAQLWVRKQVINALAEIAGSTPPATATPAESAPTSA